MSGKRLGERLSQFIPLSGHDIEEILAEQNVTGRRFGEVALQLGMCEPQHVWQAWSSQLEDAPQKLNLDDFPVDAQALACVPRSLAVKYHVMPLRVSEHRVVLAIDPAMHAKAFAALTSTLAVRFHIVHCSHHQISTALRRYYVASSAA